MKPGTKKVFKNHGWRIDRAVHNYVYFAFYDIYITNLLRFGRLAVKYLHWFKPLYYTFEFVFARYHAKVLTSSEVNKLLKLDKDVNIGPDRSKKIIPFKYADKIILNEPKFIAVMDCACRMSRENPCQPVTTCIAVGKPTAEFWLDVGKKFHARQISQEEALEIINNARTRGQITTAWFKVATGGQTGVICCCCSCCCGALESSRLAQQVTGKPPLTMFAASGYSVAIDASKCVECGNCYEICKHNGMLKNETDNRDYSKEDCLGCGLCVEQCRGGALSLVLDESKGIPLDIDMAAKLLQHK